MAAVATTNGALTPPDDRDATAVPTSPTTKRKRSDSDMRQLSNGTPSDSSASRNAKLQDTLAHVLDYLRRFVAISHVAL